VLPSQGFERTYQIPTKNYMPHVLNPHIGSESDQSFLLFLKRNFVQIFGSESDQNVLFSSEILSNDEICSSKVMQNLLVFFF